MAVPAGIWNDDLRRYAWMELRRRFGHKSTWNGRRPEGFKQYLLDVAKLFSDLTGEDFSPGAIGNQIAWGLTPQDQVSQPHMITWMSNVILAYEADIISISDLPSLLLKEHEDGTERS